MFPSRLVDVASRRRRTSYLRLWEPIPAAEPVECIALREISNDLRGARLGVLSFFATVFSSAPRYDRSGAVAAALGVHPNTLISRFSRAGLPSPRQYLLFAQFCRAAQLLEDRRCSINRVALELNWSSTQSLHRTFRLGLGLTPGAFREQYDGAGMLRRYRTELVLPYRDRLRAFDPLRHG